MDAEPTACPRCSSMRRYGITAPARTAGRWGDSGGEYCKSLGKYFSNSMEKEAYAKDNGYVCSADFASGQMDQIVHSSCDTISQHEADVAKYKDILFTTGDASKAIAETFSVGSLKERGLLTEEARG